MHEIGTPSGILGLISFGSIFDLLFIGKIEILKSLLMFSARVILENVKKTFRKVSII